MQLIPYLRETYKLSDDLLEEIDKANTFKRYTKKSILLEPDSYSKQIFFVEKGLVRLFYYKSGKAITHNFYKEGEFVAAVEGVFMDKKSIYGIEVLEEAEVAAVSYTVIERLALEAIAVNKLVQSILLQSLIGYSYRLQSLQFETAHERYQKLCEQHPEVLLRAPLGDIASFLGISQQTLSVIRAAYKGTLNTE